ncbi:MAG: Fic family protein [Aeromicrobium sp.]|uniref:Fic family protein n=1 Tax=Aeromicrobium sp. TaxID=1871063 RepID=UPI0039E3E52A
MSETPGPPFSVSVRAADHLAKIVESITRLDLGTDFRLDIRLHRENRVRSIYSSLAIEGNLLSLNDVADVLNGQQVWGRPVDIQEVKNAHDAYEHLLTFDPYEVDDFLTAHRLLTQGLIREAGRFRSGDVAVFDGETPIHTGARPQFVPGLIGDLFAWVRESDLHPVLLSAIVHCEIETIHPFADGNGRIGRLWQTLILARWNGVFASLPMESVVFTSRPQYYQALRTAQRNHDATVFIEFSLGAILQAIEEVLVTYGDINVGVNVGRNVGVNDAVLTLLNVEPTLSASAIADRLGKTSRTIERHLADLKAAGRVRREGSAKAGRWVVID